MLTEDGPSGPTAGLPPPRRAVGLPLAAATLLLAACGGGRPSEGDGAVAWTVPQEEACQGITVGWPVGFDDLDALVGSELVPAEGPEPGTGVLLLFAAECTGSTVDGAPTGSFVTAHVLVPVEPPRLPADLLPGPPPPRWVAVPRTLGPVGSPVAALFGERGFPVREAATAMELRPGEGGGFRGRFTIDTQTGGRVSVEASFPDSLAAFEGETGLVTRSGDRWSVATGPESASRYEPGTARVRFEDPDFLGGLELDERPPIVSLDRHFHWDFTFRRESLR